MDILALLLGLLIGLVVGAIGAGVAVLRLVRSRPAAEPATPLVDPAVVAAQHQAELAELRAAETAVQSEIRADLAAAHSRVDALQDQLRAAQEQYRETVERHRAEAEARTERERAESKVLQALAPVRESLTDMQRKVIELETQRNQQHGQLAQQLRSAAESEERLRSTAEALASALRSNSTRGVWGETQLRSVVEAAGLIERVDFDVQSSIHSESGAGRPDMIVRLPGGKSIALDAKVPFNAYLEASQIPATATGPEAAQREALLKQHVKAVRDHITALGSKAYWTGLESSPELVIAFIPSESLVSSALEADPSIMEFAFGKRVALASPVTLWSVLKTVAFSWQQDVLTQEAKQLFDLSRTLYSRLSTTAGHIEKLGRSLERTVKDYNGFVGSFERQVFPAARKLNALDESKVIGVIEGIEEAPRELTAFELVSELEPRDMHGIDKLAIEEQERARALEAERDTGAA
ncbi:MULTISPECIES: DNA recombination protein RmuC [Leifsonia]|uniref:DNA recombination protein RmuC n=1 Tax=Leifsonia soli TaxID=582665 RepID=A0A852SY25_9MICO|nr:MULTISPECIES: DNA recombination protein RmuC [Leifsonia]NYD73999.1 DNA recombination protein RmuC [Leifsonia soli]SEA67913.1 DNA recombination protein RmuC [Leifsonia sp. 21MFCrub1.1]